MWPLQTKINLQTIGRSVMKLDCEQLCQYDGKRQFPHAKFQIYNTIPAGSFLVGVHLVIGFFLVTEGKYNQILMIYI